MWSVGVLLFILVSGQPPFKGKKYPAIQKNIQSGNFKMDGAIWDQIPIDLKDFISSLLQVDIAQRFTADEALAHPWINRKTDVHNRLRSLKSIVHLRFSVYYNLLKIRKNALSKICLTKLQAEFLEQSFKYFDSDDTGQISAQNL